MASYLLFLQAAILAQPFLSTIALFSAFLQSFSVCCPHNLLLPLKPVPSNNIDLYQKPSERCVEFLETLIATLVRFQLTMRDTCIWCI